MRIAKRCPKSQITHRNCEHAIMNLTALTGCPNARLCLSWKENEKKAGVFTYKCDEVKKG
jgi:hypothetical protein